MSSSDDNFYEDLPGFERFDEFTQLKWYVPLPSSWYLVITDVRDSTKAIQAGRYKEVNALGVSSVAALVNAVKPLTIPYVFGGDGATLCVPQSKKSEVESALSATKHMARESFRLDLRIGMVPMSRVKSAGREVLIAKYQPSFHYKQAMFLGDGLGYAESLVKDPDPHNPFLLPEERIEPKGSFAGFECRWNSIPSPHEETVTILVKALEGEGVSEEAVYSEVLRNIIEIYGDEEYHHPVREELLTLADSLDKLATEIGVQTARLPPWRRWLYSLKLRLLVHLGRSLMDNRVKIGHVDWGLYKKTLIANTDYRKCDQVLRMIVSGTSKQRKRLRDVFEQLRRAGKIVYGIHAAPDALLTCLISDYDTDHVHFLDGSNGGYALAAKEMKKQLAELRR